MKPKISSKGLVKDIIIIVLLILLILSKLDFKFNILDKNNWIDIFLCLITLIPTSIFSLLIYLQAEILNKRENEFEIKILSKQLDTDLRDKRLQIYCSFNSLKKICRISDVKLMTLNFIKGQHDQNNIILNKLYDSFSEISSLNFQAKMLFKEDEKIKERLEEILSVFLEYIQSVSKFMTNIYDANEEAIKYLCNSGYDVKTPWIPKELIYTDPERFDEVLNIFNKFNDTDEYENKLFELICNQDFIDMFDKYINISIEKGGF